MLNRWRNRENNKTDHISSPKKAIQTKVMYQYPKKTPFRFPVIPDEIEQEETPETPETPAYQRRRPRKKREENIKRQETIVRNSKEKFVPSEVPSPIYGYQNRKEEKKIEDVPAFLRKQPKQELEIQREESESAVIELKKAEQNKSDLKSSNKSLDKQNREIQQKAKQTTSENDRPSHLIKRPAEHIHSRKKQKRITSEHKNQQQVPFNVMMTARDKQLLTRKQKTQPVKQVSYDEDRCESKQQIEMFPAYLLNDPEVKSTDDKIWVQNQQELLEQTLKHFNVKAKVVNATQGPSVTRFEVQPELGVKVSRVRNLNDDIKLNMSAKDIRIEAPIPGKNTIGIEIPNIKPQMVGLQEIFKTEAFKQSVSPLTIGLGLTVEGDPLVTNIAKMPHGLIAGATGSGKSVCINTILMSLLYKSNHEDVKMLLIDPKMVELAPYNDIPHLVAPVITDVKAATAALKWAVNEMEDRYDRFVQEGVRDIERYNVKVMKEGRAKEKMPFMVIVIDELADLMMASPQDVEDSICRIAQKARACGMHLLLATQRPSVDVITGLIKANIPTRIAFSVSSQIDSRTIIDTNGAERLLGKGDMLFMENGTGKSVRLQGAFVSDEEIDRVTNHARTIAKPHYLFEQEQLLKQIETEADQDDLLEEVIEFVLEQNHASTSLLQRQFRIGYNRAARLIDSLESKGIISGQNGSKPRDVLLSKSQLQDMR